MYHLSVKTISRASGRSATAAAAYRSGSEISDERTGEIHDYTRKGGVEYSEIFLPENSPEWAKTRNELWNAAELAETRKNSTVAREFEVAIPKDLNPEQSRELVRDFTQQLVDKHGFAAEVSIHKDHEQDWKGHEKNFEGQHAHILCSTRRLEAEGFTEKTRELDGGKSGRENVEHWREKWADTANKHLQEAGYDTRIDHRSLQDQGIEREPTKHMGPEATAMERRGEITEIGDVNRRIEAAYEQGIAERAALAKENAQIIDTTTTLEKALQEREQYQSNLDTLKNGAESFTARFEALRDNGNGLEQSLENKPPEKDTQDHNEASPLPSKEPETFEAWFSLMEAERMRHIEEAPPRESEAKKQDTPQFSEESKAYFASLNQDTPTLSEADKAHFTSRGEQDQTQHIHDLKELFKNDLTPEKDHDITKGNATSKAPESFEAWVEKMEAERKNNEKDNSLDNDSHDHKGNDYDNGR